MVEQLSDVEQVIGSIPIKPTMKNKLWCWECKEKIKKGELIYLILDCSGKFTCKKCNQEQGDRIIAETLKAGCKISYAK